MTPEEADRRSVARAKRNQRRLAVVAVFVVAVFLTLAFLLQREQMRLDHALTDMCQQRRANAQRAVTYYDGMIAIERQNKIQDPEIVAERIALWQAAKPVVPTC